MMLSKQLLLVLFLPACAGSLGRDPTPHLPGVGAEAAVPSPRCAALDDRHAIWTSVAQGSGLLAGAAGVSSLPLHDEGKAAQVSVAVGALAFGALAAFSASLSSSASESWSHECK